MRAREFIIEGIQSQYQYHGTFKPVSLFKPFTHFGTISAAMDRLEDLEDGSSSTAWDKKKVYQVKLNIKNPAELQKDIFDNHTLKDYVSELVNADIITQDEASTITTPEQFIKLLRNKDYDGLVYKNEWEDPGSLSYVILDPSQVEIIDVMDLGKKDGYDKMVKLRKASPSKRRFWYESKQGVAEGGTETSWSDGNEKITLQDILELTKHVKQINLPINDKLKSKLLHWEGNPEEIERINQVTVSNEFPILVMLDGQGQIDWILDGNHRLHKAIRSQAKTIPAKLIKPSDLNDKAKRIFSIIEQSVEEGELKLPSRENTKAKEWINKVYSKLQPHPFTRGEYLMGFSSEEFAVIKLSPSKYGKEDDVVHIDWFQAYPLGKGVGKKAMQILQKMAAEDGISLSLQTWSKGKVAEKSLKKFYKSLGFQQDAGRMSWHPEGKKEIEEDIEIPSGKSRKIKRTVPRFWYHNLGGRELGPQGEILPYKYGRETKIFQDELFRDPKPEGFVYLSPRPLYDGAIKIDAAKLDPDLMRLTGQVEGYAIYAGAIPAEAQVGNES